MTDGWVGRGSNGRLSGDEVARLTDELAGLTAAGLPLPSGVMALGEELPHGRLRRTLERLGSALESGVPLGEALAAQGDRLPSHLRGLVVAAARTGRLGEVLARFAGYANVGVELRRSLWLRLLNPIFTLLFAGSIFIFVSVTISSGFTNLLMDFGMPLPVLSRVALAIASAVSRAWWPLVEGCGGLLVVVIAVVLLTPVEFRRGVAWMIPLFGPVWHFSDLAEFSHLLGLLLESDVPLAEALRLAGEGVRNGEVASASRQAARQVEEGLPLAEALGRRGLFPKGFALILSWAENHRGLPEALHMAGEMFEARAKSQASFVRNVCSALALLTILGGVITLIVAVILPMLMLLRRLM
jgi:general secretion pathway protein F